jgi:hypothetical protein
VLALAMVGALVAGCGVPTQTGVQVDGPVAGVGLPDSGEPRVPPGPDEADTAERLVEYFLRAAAADPDDPVDELRQFIHSDRAAAWQPDPQVVIVRVKDRIPTPAGALTRVRLEVELIGTLRDGIAEPRPGAERLTVDLEVAREPAAAGDEVSVDLGDPRYRILNPPDLVMLEDRELGDRGHLLPSPVYFWDATASVLVPDLRWLPTALAPAQRAQAKLQWLFEGPAPWLGSLSVLPGDVALDGNVVWREDRLDVALTPAAGDLDLARLNAQLWWTLRDQLQDDRTVWLMIDGLERLVVPDRSANPAARDTRPDSFVVLDGAVAPYLGAPLDPELSALTDGFAGQIVSAAVTRADRPRAALVHLDAGSGHRLSVVTRDGVTTTDLRATSMSRPVWLNHPGSAGLVAADGRLHQFRPDQPAAPELAVPGLVEPVTAVAVAPDGRRLALVAGGRLYVATLLRHDDRALVVTSPLRLPTTATDLSGVAFVQESRLAVVGREDGRSLLYELSVDGVYESELLGGLLGAQPDVTNVVGFPGDPSSNSPRGEVMYEADGRAYHYQYPRDPRLISAADLAVRPVPDGDPRAPFFGE